jgi:hypothetical protein
MSERLAFEIDCHQRTAETILSFIDRHVNSSNHKRVEQLRLSRFSCTDEATERVLSSAFASYRTVALAQFFVGRECAERIQLPAFVRSVSVEFLATVTPTAVRDFLECVLLQPSVVSLEVDGKSRWCIDPATSALVSSTTLQHLDCREHGTLHQTVIEGIVSLLERNVLQSLSVQCGDAARAISRALANCTTLRSLELYACANDEVVTACCGALLSNYTLRHLSLPFNRLSESTGSALASMLRLNRGLHELNLSLTSFDGSSFWDELLDAVEANGSLLRVCVEGGTAAQASRLAKLLKRNEGIKWTKERRNDIVQKLFGLADLRLPSLVLIEVVQQMRPFYELIPYFRLMTVINAVTDAAWRVRDRESASER